jgi:hypothetical protein
MTSQGSPLSCFRRAVSGTGVTNALAAAAELGSLDLADALRYAVRWASRYFESTPNLDLASAHALMAALNGLPESLSSLEALLRAGGQRELAGVVAGR